MNGYRAAAIGMETEIGRPALLEIFTAADFPDADILIVGDNVPPFFHRFHRNQFEPDRVPWILLRPKPDARAPMPPAP